MSTNRPSVRLCGTRHSALCWSRSFLRSTDEKALVPESLKYPSTPDSRTWERRGMSLRSSGAYIYLHYSAGISQWGATVGIYTNGSIPFGTFQQAKPRHLWRFDEIVSQGRLVYIPTVMQCCPIPLG